MTINRAIVLVILIKALYWWGYRGLNGGYAWAFVEYASAGQPGSALFWIIETWDNVGLNGIRPILIALGIF